MTNRRQPRYNPGDRIGGRYRVHQALMGGMGEVYLCLDEQEFEPIALKTFQGSDLRIREIFEDEVANWIALERHPNIVKCEWMQILDNIPFMGLEWIAGDENRGTDLRSWLRQGPLDLSLALRFTIDIVRGLLHANEKVPSIVHRDLKPDNVLVNQDRQAKITDFGLALVAQQTGLDLENESGDDASLGQSRYVGRGVVGTPPYMTPEQWRGETALDFRTDMYAVGCILYELLTGQWVYPARTVNELRALHIDAPIPVLDGAVLVNVKQVMEGCLAKKPDDRFERLDRLLDALKQVYAAQSDEPLPDVVAETFDAIDYSNRGITFGNLGQAERAIADFDEAIRLNPAYTPAYNNRGTSYADLGQFERAIADYDKAIRLDPTLAQVYSNRGKSYRELGQVERAIADFDEAIRLGPTLAQAYYNRGTHYATLGQVERALADFDEAIRLNPTDAAAYYNRGRSYGVLGQPERAIADYDQALRLDPTDAASYVNRGAYYVALGQVERAIADFDEAIRLDPTFAQAYYNRGHSYEALGQAERALTDYDEAIRLDPTDAKAYVGRGDSYGALGQVERALADYDEAIRLDPTYALAYNNRGNRYRELGQAERALADFDEAIRLDPTDAKAYSNRGYTCTALGQAERAIADHDKAIRLDPTSSIAYFNRGASYTVLGQVERALADYDEAIRLDPTFAPVWFNKGAVLANIERLQESLTCLEKAAELGLPQGAQYAAMVRQRMGQAPAQPPANDPQAAFEAFQRAESLAAMQQTVQQFPILAQMIPTIKQVIREQVPPEHRPAFEQKLAWLRQIVEEES